MDSPSSATSVVTVAGCASTDGVSYKKLSSGGGVGGGPVSVTKGNNAMLKPRGSRGRLRSISQSSSSSSLSSSSSPSVTTFYSVSSNIGNTSTYITPSQVQQMNALPVVPPPPPLIATQKIIADQQLPQQLFKAPPNAPQLPAAGSTTILGRRLERELNTRAQQKSAATTPPVEPSRMVRSRSPSPHSPHIQASSNFPTSLATAVNISPPATPPSATASMLIHQAPTAGPGSTPPMLSYSSFIVQQKPVPENLKNETNLIPPVPPIPAQFLPGSQASTPSSLLTPSLTPFSKSSSKSSLLPNMAPPSLSATSSISSTLPSINNVRMPSANNNKQTSQEPPHDQASQSVTPSRLSSDVDPLELIQAYASPLPTQVARPLPSGDGEDIAPHQHTTSTTSTASTASDYKSKTLSVSAIPLNKIAMVPSPLPQSTTSTTTASTYHPHAYMHKDDIGRVNTIVTPSSSTTTSDLYNSETLITPSTTISLTLHSLTVPASSSNEAFLSTITASSSITPLSATQDQNSPRAQADVASVRSGKSLRSRGLKRSKSLNIQYSQDSLLIGTPSFVPHGVKSGGDGGVEGSASGGAGGVTIRYEEPPGGWMWRRRKSGEGNVVVEGVKKR